MENRDDILNKLGDGVLNSRILETIRSESDPQRFIEAFDLAVH